MSLKILLELVARRLSVLARVHQLDLDIQHLGICLSVKSAVHRTRTEGPLQPVMDPGHPLPAMLFHLLKLLTGIRRPPTVHLVSHRNRQQSHQV